MPIIILVGQADRFSHQILTSSEKKYICKYFKEPFLNIKFELTNQNPSVLYLISDLCKPERYDIYCLTRKNQQIFITIVDELKNDSLSSDKNQIIMIDFNDPIFEKALLNMKITPSTASIRSKGVSLRTLSEIKEIIKKVNNEFKFSGMDIVFQPCEERIINAWKINPRISNEEVEEAYRTLVKDEIKNKGFIL